jgi:hypothetical protein
MAADARWGVMLDGHGVRGDDGLCVSFWDGWYSERLMALLLDVLERVRREYPGRNAWLIEMDDEGV